MFDSSCTPFPDCADPLGDRADEVQAAILAMDSCPQAQEWYQEAFDDGRILTFESSDPDDRGAINFVTTDSVTIGIGSAAFDTFTVVSTMKHEFGHEDLASNGNSLWRDENLAEDYAWDDDCDPTNQL